MSVADVNSLRIELSNTCDMSRIHSKCPAKNAKAPKHLPIVTVRKIICELWGWNGHRRQLGFHMYNEPMIDPRLYDIVRFASNTLSDWDFLIWTNGNYLSENLLLDFTEFGVKFWVSAYTTDVLTRCLRLSEKHKGAFA